MHCYRPYAEAEPWNVDGPGVAGGHRVVPRLTVHRDLKLDGCRAGARRNQQRELEVLVEHGGGAEHVRTIVDVFAGAEGRKVALKVAAHTRSRRAGWGRARRARVGRRRAWAKAEHQSRGYGEERHCRRALLLDAWVG